MRRLLWVVTAVVLAVLVLAVPRLAPGATDDSFPIDVDLGDRAELWGGSVRVDEVVASPRWTDGEADLSLEKEGGLFVRVTVTTRPAQEASSVQGLIRADGRSWDLSDSDRAGDHTDQTPPGFDSTVHLVFEVPEDVVRDGELRLSFVAGSEASLQLGPEQVERVDVLEVES